MTQKISKQKAPIVAVDTVIFTVKEGKLNVLLIKIKYGSFAEKWGVPGGIVKMNETLDEAAERELFEKTGMKNVYLEQLYSFGKLKRDPKTRIVSVAYFALADSNKTKLKATKKYEDIRWFQVDKLRKIAYDHNEIINYALLRLKYKIAYTNVIYSLMPQKFTLGSLQKVYEVILGKKIDKRNFRKKILSLNLIRETGIEMGVSHRPSKLYSFKKRRMVIVEVF